MSTLCVYCMCEHSPLCSCFPKGCLCENTDTCLVCYALLPSGLLFCHLSHFQSDAVDSLTRARGTSEEGGGLQWEWEFLFFILQRLLPDSSTLIFPSSPIGMVSSKAGVKERPASRSRTMARENIHRANIKLL